MAAASPADFDRRTPLLVALAAAALYLGLLCAVPYWGDSASIASHLDTAPTPFARSYWIFKRSALLLAAFGLEAATAANAASALWGALAAGLAAAVVARMGGDRAAAWAAGGSLAVAHTVWFHAEVAEVYTLHLCFELGLLWLALGARLKARDAVALGLLAGLSLNHHRMILVQLPLVLGWALGPGATQRRRVLAGLAVGLVPFGVLCLLNLPGAIEVPEGADRGSIWLQRALLGGRFSAGEVAAGAGKPLAANLAYVARFVALCFPGPGLLLAGLGFAAVWRTRSGRLLAALALAYLWVGLRFGWAGDQHTFLIPLHGTIAVAVGLGVAALSRRRIAVAAAWLAVLTPPASYAALAFTELGAMVLPSASAEQRVELLWPGKREHEVGDLWGRRRLAELPRDAVLISQWREGTVFEYLLEVRGLRDDVDVVLHRSGPVVLAEPERPTFVTWSPPTAEPPPEVGGTELLLQGDRPGIRRVVIREW